MKTYPCEGHSPAHDTSGQMTNTKSRLWLWNLCSPINTAAVRQRSIYLTNLEPCCPNLQYKASNIIIIVITIRNDKTPTLHTMYISLQLYSVHHKPFLAQKDLFRARGLPCKFRAFEMQSYEAKYPWKHFIAKNSYIPMECCNTTQMPFWVKEKKLLS